MNKKILLVILSMFTAGMTYGNLDIHTYVDLGLPSGTLWATCNVGANSPEDYGDYFAWGETKGYKSGKRNFALSDYKWFRGDFYSLFITKYNSDSNFGTTDNRLELSPEDDAAYVNWGKDWRMPSLNQIRELKTNCRWVWTTHNNVEGYEVKGPNGNTIFLPAAGYCSERSFQGKGSLGSYWSRTLYSDEPPHAYILFFSPDESGWNYYDRIRGRSIRPVRCADINSTSATEYQPEEIMPQFPGGDAALLEWLRNTMQYPGYAKDYHIEGTMLIGFVIDKDGSVIEPTILKSVDPSLDKEALRVIGAMPKWTPGMQKGKLVQVRYQVPIRFRPPSDQENL